MGIYDIAGHRQDPTASAAFGGAQRHVRTKCKRLTGVIFEIASMIGLRIVGELHFKDQKTGYEFIIKCKEEEH